MSAKRTSPAGLIAAMKSLLVRPVAFHPILGRVCGSATAGLMLSQALYWTDVQERTRPELGGWFYKTRDEWTEEICLSKYEQLSARKTLVDLGFIQTELRGLPAKTYYRVNAERLHESILQLSGKQTTRSLKSSHQAGGSASSSKTSKQEREKIASKSDKIQPTFSKGTEITPETTSISTPVGDALKEWLPAKDQLKEIFPLAEWKLWVRPAYLLKVMSGTTFLIALPPNIRTFTAAKARLPELCRTLGRPAVFTHYPDDYVREQMKREYPELYAQWLGIRKTGV